MDKLMASVETALLGGVDLSNAYTKHEKSVSLHFRRGEDADAFVTAYIEYLRRRNISQLTS